MALLQWFEPRRSRYPWRGSTDPYRVLVSDVMLQQTQARRVIPAYRGFLARFPSVEALASAPRREVVRSWDGLGYNRRAVALSEAARAVVRDYGGHVPRDVADLERLPGVGPYTSAAVASIAFGVPVAAIDTNVRRVVARVHTGCEADDVEPALLRELAQRWVDPADPGGWNQALMDLGREVCRPQPRCDTCPLERRCRFRASGVAARPAPRHQPPFEGSFRQIRGAVVSVLREHRSLTFAELAGSVAADPSDVRLAVERLEREGLVDAGPAAIEGRARGRIRLAD